MSEELGMFLYYLNIVLNTAFLLAFVGIIIYMRKD